MLLKQETLRGIESGAITVAFRRWRRPTVKAGGTLGNPERVGRLPRSVGSGIALMRGVRPARLVENQNRVSIRHPAGRE